MASSYCIWGHTILSILSSTQVACVNLPNYFVTPHPVLLCGQPFLFRLIVFISLQMGNLCLLLGIHILLIDELFFKASLCLSNQFMCLSLSLLIISWRLNSNSFLWIEDHYRSYDMEVVWDGGRQWQDDVGFHRHRIPIIFGCRHYNDCIMHRAIIVWLIICWYAGGDAGGVHIIVFSASNFGWLLMDCFPSWTLTHTASWTNVCIFFLEHHVCVPLQYT
jgi:hypothetical protein